MGERLIVVTDRKAPDDMDRFYDEVEIQFSDGLGPIFRVREAERIAEGKVEVEEL